MVAIIIIIIIIITKMKIGCVNINTSDQIKEKFSSVEVAVWCRLLNLCKCKRR